MAKPDNPFRYFNSSAEVIRLGVMMYVKFPLSLRNVEDLLHERGIDVSYETIRFWWNKIRPDGRRGDQAQAGRDGPPHWLPGSQSWDKPRLGLGSLCPA